MTRLYNILNKLSIRACIETGTKDGWTYRKYSDGTFEATTGADNGGTGAMQASGSVYYTPSVLVSFPSIGITAIRSCDVNIMPQEDYIMSYFLNRLTNSGVYMGYLRLGSGSAVSNIKYRITITGTYS